MKSPIAAPSEHEGYSSGYNAGTWSTPRYSAATKFGVEVRCRVIDIIRMEPKLGAGDWNLGGMEPKILKETM